MPKSDREKIRLVPQVIKELQEEYGGNAPKDILLNELSDKYNMDEEKAEELITKLKRQGSIYEPKQGYYKVV
jgi:replicative DNA helicase Mcm